jgi:hypothetical protein
VAFVLGVPVAVVQMVDVVAVRHGGMTAALAVLMGVPVVRRVTARLALVPVAFVLTVQMPVVRVVDVVAVPHLGVTAVRTVDVLVGGVLLVKGGHRAHLRLWREAGCPAWRVARMARSLCDAGWGDDSGYRRELS